jgi:hypothetical protein
MTSAVATMLSTFIGTGIALGFHNYFPVLTADKRQVISTFIIGAFMAIGFEHYRRLQRALSAGLLFMILSEISNGYIVFLGQLICLPVLTLFLLRRVKGIDPINFTYKKYLFLSFISLITLYCSTVFYLNAALILEGSGLLPSQR